MAPPSLKLISRIAKQICQGASFPSNLLGQTAAQTSRYQPGVVLSDFSRISLSFFFGIFKRPHAFLVVTHSLTALFRVARFSIPHLPATLFYTYQNFNAHTTTAEHQTNTGNLISYMKIICVQGTAGQLACSFKETRDISPKFS